MLIKHNATSVLTVILSSGANVIITLSEDYTLLSACPEVRTHTHAQHTTTEPVIASQFIQLHLLIGRRLYTQTNLKTKQQLSLPLLLLVSRRQQSKQTKMWAHSQQGK